MNWVDLAISAVFLFYLFEGLRRGFIEQALELIGFVITLFFAIWTYPLVADWVVGHIGLTKAVAEPIGFFIAWFFFQVVYSVILRLTYPLIPGFIRNALPNRLAGLIPAFSKALVIVAIVLTVTVILPVPEKLKTEINHSAIGSRLVSRSAQVESYLNKALGRNLRESLTFLTVPAQTEQIVAPDERVDLKFKTGSVTVDSRSEEEMLKLINQERAKAGLAALKLDPKLAEVARAHSQDMLAKGYFAHENLAGESPFDRMSKAGLTFKVAGENIAYAANVELAHNGLMRSPGHRANILSSEFGRIGIGVIDAGIFGKMFTQDFRD